MRAFLHMAAIGITGLLALAIVITSVIEIYWLIVLEADL